MKIISVVGARPNFMKVAPLHKSFQKYGNDVNHLICHTGQHYDANMSDVFFKQLSIPQPNYFLGIGSGTHAEQTGKIMIEFEKLLLKEKPDLVIVVGDVNSTIACALTAKKLHIKVAHVEAGLRSFDREMPEEINRILTDSISDYLFVTETSGLINLNNEGIDNNKMFFVGNCMIDSLINILELSRAVNIKERYGLTQEEFILVTMHRPSNVDAETRLSGLIRLLNSLALHIKIVFPIHPRTRKNLEGFGFIKSLHDNILITDPIGYIDFIGLMAKANMILTDSGGIQEESTYLGIPCITLRNTTERPSTVDIGTNQLVGDDFEKAEEAAIKVINSHKKVGSIPELWDGKAAERVCEIIIKKLTE